MMRIETISGPVCVSHFYRVEFNVELIEFDICIDSRILDYE